MIWFIVGESQNDIKVFVLVCRGKSLVITVGPIYLVTMSGYFMVSWAPIAGQ